MKGILGKKIGMTQVFAKDGKLIPVTVVSVEPNVVMQIKTKETDGYEAIQLGFATKNEKHSTKADMGHAKKANAQRKIQTQSSSAMRRVSRRMQSALRSRQSFWSSGVCSPLRILRVEKSYIP